MPDIMVITAMLLPSESPVAGGTQEIALHCNISQVGQTFDLLLLLQIFVYRQQPCTVCLTFYGFDKLLNIIFLTMKKYNSIP